MSPVDQVFCWWLLFIGFVSAGFVVFEGMIAEARMQQANKLMTFFQSPAGTGLSISGISHRIGQWSSPPNHALGDDWWITRGLETPHPTTGYILAWRAWNLIVTVQGIRLMSLTNVTIWEPRKRIQAYCPQHSSGPVDACSCGIYALQTPQDAKAHCHGHVQAAHYVSSYPIVLGRVALWGRVIIGDRGFRAQYAYPYLLYTTLQDPLRGLLADTYGIEIYDLASIPSNGSAEYVITDPKEEKT